MKPRASSTLHRLSLWLPVGAFLGLSFYLSSRPGHELPELMPDYVAHALEYLALGLLVLRAFNGGLMPRPTGRTFLRAAALCLAWGIANEIHQSWVPGRHATASDVVSDFVGAVAACGLFPWLRRVRLGEVPNG